MINENIEYILSRTNVSEIKRVISENEEDSYNFLIRHFCFLPSKYCSEEVDFDKNPVYAIRRISGDVDGSRGMKTSVTPKAVITLYQLLWSNVLDTKEIVKLKGRRPFNGVDNYSYKMTWKDGINGKVSGDILNSFPKQDTINCLCLNLNDANFQLKLFARLCYTLGNFMPVPCNGRGIKSMNTIHSHFCFGAGHYERMDYFLYNILNYKNESKCAKNYNNFGEYIKKDYIKINYLNDYIENNSIFDLATKQGKIEGPHNFTRLSKENINIYIENVNARIIARGNRMLEKLKDPKNLNKDTLIMFTND